VNFQLNDKHVYVIAELKPPPSQCQRGGDDDNEDEDEDEDEAFKDEDEERMKISG
jgi:hypothetical protein